MYIHIQIFQELQQNLDSSIRAFERQYGEWGKSDD